MHYREGIIDGRWHFKEHPEGKWIPMSTEMLIDRINDCRQEMKEAAANTTDQFPAIATLKRWLKEAISIEDYLEAAELRDKINAYK